MSTEKTHVKKAYLLFPGFGAMLVLTSYDSILAPRLLRQLKAKGISKFIAYEVPVDLAKSRYGGHFDVVLEDLSETDDLRVLDWDGRRAFENFSFKEMGAPIFHEPE
jgi:hypothetical protein